MARTTLTPEQRDHLLEWLAADFPPAGIKLQFAERGWPKVSDQLLAYYRKTYVPEIADLRAARRDSALNRGYAVKEARIAALNAHAEALESIIWVPDKNGRLWNEAAWRETLDDLAQETGGRIRKQEVSGPNGKAIEIMQHQDLSALSDAELGQLEAIVRKVTHADPG